MKPERRKAKVFPSHNNFIRVAVAAASAIVAARASAQQLNLLYEWSFDGANPAAPTVSAGGGTLAVTNSTNGSVAFSTTGGVRGGALDLSHNQQWGTLDPTGYASTDAPGNALT